jgi:transcriptional regulator with XRE-family HTH domain
VLILTIELITEEELQFLKGSTFGQRLKFIRERLQGLYGKQYNVSNVAIHAGVTPQNIFQIEKGKIKNPSSATVKALAKYYKVDLDIFYDDFYGENQELKPFEIGDVQAEIILPEVLSARSTCIISVLSGIESINEKMELTEKEVVDLIKRIKFEIELLKQGD